MGIKVTVEETKAMNESAIKDLIRAALWQAVEDIARKVLAEVKERVPVDNDKYRPAGKPHLRDLYHIEWDKDHLTAFVTAGKEGYWDQYVEFGTWQIAAEPHLTPASDQVEDQSMNIVVTRLNNVIDRL